jgi:hypothetical protein
VTPAGGGGGYQPPPANPNPAQANGGVSVTVSGGAYPSSAPPARRAETAGSRPGYIWIYGRWDWRNGQWAWIDGHWEHARSGKTWVDGSWQNQGGRWVWVEGSWSAGASAQPAPAGPPPGGGPVIRDHRH